MTILVTILGSLIGVFLVGVICHWHLAHLIDRNVRPLTEPETLMVSRVGRLPLLESPYSQTGILANGDMIEEIRLNEERMEEARRAAGRLPVLSASCVTPNGEIVEDEL